MAGQTIGGLFKDSSRGEAALMDLKAAGFATAQISELTEHVEAAPAPTKLSNPLTDFFADHTTSGSDFQKNLTDLGMTSDDADYFEDGVARGGALVTVKADARASEAQQILARHGADLGKSTRSGALEAPVVTTGTTTSRLDDTASKTIELKAERLSIDKTRVASGTVRIGKRVVSEQQSIDVPVSHDELVIERRKVSDGAVGGTIGADETIRVPLARDEVIVSKQTFATEEVDIGKREVGGVERVSDAVRHEELVVDGDSTAATLTGNKPTL